MEKFLSEEYLQKLYVVIKDYKSICKKEKLKRVASQDVALILFYIWGGEIVYNIAKGKETYLNRFMLDGKTFYVNLYNDYKIITGDSSKDIPELIDISQIFSKVSAIEELKEYIKNTARLKFEEDV